MFTSCMDPQYKLHSSAQYNYCNKKYLLQYISNINEHGIWPNMANMPNGPMQSMEI